MGNKKKEHILFDRMNRIRPRISNWIKWTSPIQKSSRRKRRKRTKR